MHVFDQPGTLIKRCPKSCQFVCYSWFSVGGKLPIGQ